MLVLVYFEMLRLGDFDKNKILIILEIRFTITIFYLIKLHKTME